MRNARGTRGEWLSPHPVLGKRAVQLVRTQEAIGGVPTAERMLREPGSEACPGPVTHAVPARFPQLWRGLLTSISYQPCGFLGSPEFTSKIALIISAHESLRQSLPTLQEADTQRVRVLSGRLVACAWKR